MSSNTIKLSKLCQQLGINYNVLQVPNRWDPPFYDMHLSETVYYIDFRGANRASKRFGSFLKRADCVAFFCGEVSKTIIETRNFLGMPKKRVDLRIGNVVVVNDSGY